MDVRYRKSFLRDLKKLKKQPVYDRIFALAFQALPDADDLKEIPSVKAMTGYRHRFRIRVGNYRVGCQIKGSVLELVRVLDRREFYRYFP